MALIDDLKAALRISITTTAFNPEIADLITAAQDDLRLSGVLAENITGIAVVATLALQAVQAGQTVAINGITFTAHATTTTPALREFSVSGNDAADATELTNLINNATYGVIGITATVNSNVITLTATIMVCGTVITIMAANTITVTMIEIEDTTDPLIRRAITTYVKANFGWDNPDAERLQKAYDLLKAHLTLTEDYAYYAVMFEVTNNTTAAAIRMALVVLGCEAKTTDENGQAVFYRRAASNLKYAVTADNYESDDDEDNLVDVSASVTVAIPLTAR